MPNFTTKVDFSTQIKEYQNTEGTLSGSVKISQYTILGTDYVDLPLGLDTTTSGVTSTYIGITNGYFTGTTGSTTFYFNDPNMDIANPYLSAITSSNSGTTQYVAAFQSIYNITVDGNYFDVYFSGVSFDMIPVTLSEYSPGLFSGITFTNTLKYLSGTTYPWWFLKSGSTTWNEVKGRTKTDRLTVVDGANTGYVLTAVNNDGDATWQPVSGGGTFTGNTSGDCIIDLYVRNLHGCSPILLHDLFSGVSNSNYFNLNDGTVNTQPTPASPSNLILYNKDSFGRENYLGLGNTFNVRLNAGSDYFTIGGTSATLYTSAEFNLQSGQKNILSRSSEGIEFKTSNSIGGGAGSLTIFRANNSNGNISNDINSGGLQGEIVFGIPNLSFVTDLPIGVMGTGLGVQTTGATIGYEYLPVFISTPRSRAYDNVNYTSIKNVLFGGGSNNVVYTGVTNSALIGGSGNTINSYLKNTVILAGEAITATTSNTVYVPDLVIKKSASVPTSSGDTVGDIGSVTWDNSYLYVKTNIGWGRTLLDYGF